MAASPYGFWTSPITSDLVVADSIRLEQVALDGDAIYWTETQPQKRGRTFVYRVGADGEPERVTPDDGVVRANAWGAFRMLASVMSNPFRYFNSSPEVIRLVVMMYVRYPLSLRNVEDLLAERGIDISHETVRFWWNRFGPMFAAEIRKRRVAHMRGYPRWRWHLDEVFVKVNGRLCYLWRAVDHEGEVLEAVAGRRS